MSSGRDGRSGFPGSAVEFIVGTVVALRARSRAVPRQRARWRSGATEFHLPARLVPHTRQITPATQPAGQSRLMRPILLVGFLIAFAGIGVGFNDLQVEPDAAVAPGTPVPQVVIAREPAPGAASANDATETSPNPTATNDSAGAGVLAASIEEDESPTAEPTATETPVPTESPADTTTQQAPPPTATPAPRTATPVPSTPTPAPQWNYHPVTHLSEAEVRAAATQAGWPAYLLDQLVEVAWCESSYRPNASNAWAYGIMQLVPNWFDYAGVDFALWTDPVVNMRVAYSVYNYDLSRGNAPWYQWVCQPSSAASAPTATPEPPVATPTALPPTATAASDHSSEP